MQDVSNTGLQHSGVLGEAKEKWVLELPMRVEGLELLLDKSAKKEENAEEEEEEACEWSSSTSESCSAVSEGEPPPVTTFGVGDSVDWRSPCGKWVGGRVLSILHNGVLDILADGVKHRTFVNCVQHPISLSYTQQGPVPPKIPAPRVRPTPPPWNKPVDWTHKVAARQHAIEMRKAAVVADIEARYLARQKRAGRNRHVPTARDQHAQRGHKWLGVAVLASRTLLFYNQTAQQLAARRLQHLLIPLIRKVIYRRKLQCPPQHEPFVTTVLSRYLTGWPHNKVVSIVRRATMLELSKKGAAILRRGDWVTGCFVCIQGSFTPCLNDEEVVAHTALIRVEQAPETVCTTEEDCLFCIVPRYLIEREVRGNASLEKWLAARVLEQRVAYAKEHRKLTVALLQSCPFFSHWTRPSLEKAVECAVVQLYDKHEEVAIEREVVLNVHVIAEGRGMLVRRGAYKGMESCALRARTNVKWDPSRMEKPWIVPDEETAKCGEQNFVIGHVLGQAPGSHDHYELEDGRYLAGNLEAGSIVGLDCVAGMLSDESFITSTSVTLWAVPLARLLSSTPEQDMAVLYRWKAVRAAGIITTSPITPSHLLRMTIFRKLDSSVKKQLLTLLWELTTLLRLSYHAPGVVFEDTTACFVGFASRGVLQCADNTMDPLVYGQPSKSLFALTTFDPYHASATFTVKTRTFLCLWTLSSKELSDCIINSPFADLVLSCDTLPRWVTDAVTCDDLGAPTGVVANAHEDEMLVSKPPVLPKSHRLMRLAAAEAECETKLQVLRLIRAEQGSFYQKKRQELWCRLRTARQDVSKLRAKGISHLVWSHEGDETEDSVAGSPHSQKHTSPITFGRSGKASPKAVSKFSAEFVGANFGTNICSSFPAENFERVTFTLSNPPVPRPPPDSPDSAVYTSKPPKPVAETQNIPRAASTTGHKQARFATLKLKEHSRYMTGVERKQQEFVQSTAASIDAVRQTHVPLKTTFADIVSKWEIIERERGLKDFL
eukprot:TRINITY_DN10227_c0_g1_i1.p1 TRINITY_DN10227_c0_g1~~TRINITY_DN10227_c0_g1_i1.p1  ORF type:complete len:1001 (+),score=167.73 TRINITY_DN10227_c0_g1_i1:94-3096(+)